MNALSYALLSYGGCALMLLVMVGIAAAFILFHWGNPPRR